jgi:hypothetical protein
MLLGLATMTMLLVTRPSDGSAADPFRAGEHGLSTAFVDNAAARPVIERATSIAAILGLPSAARRAVTHVIDRFGGQTYDEVIEFDQAGRMTGLQRFDEAGALRAAVRFGWIGAGGPRLQSDDAVRARATELLGGLGVRVAGRARTGPGRVVPAPSAGGWTVDWDRVADGVRVPGDGLRIQVWPDGSFHGLSVSERGLAPRPATLIEQSTAARIASGHLDRWLPPGNRGQAGIGRTELVWAPPTDTFAPDRPDAPGSVLRLAWRVTVTTSGDFADRIRAIEIDIDAGDGSLLGGDILE